MLKIMDNDVPDGEYPLDDENYSVTVVKQGDYFDVKLYRAVVTEYTKEGFVQIDRKYPTK